jgi:hypothetical protein
MARIPTPIPKSLVRLTRRAFSGRVLETLWKLGVLVVLVVVGLGLYAAGTIGVLVGGVILASLITEPVQNAVSDLWNRNFWVFRT